MSVPQYRPLQTKRHASRLPGSREMGGLLFCLTNDARQTKEACWQERLLSE
jgi:hypothetical protein